jgi:hypothetical protein
MEVELSRPIRLLAAPAGGNGPSTFRLAKATATLNCIRGASQLLLRQAGAQLQ